MSHPGAKEASQSHAGPTALRAARATADFASDDQGTHAAPCEIVVCRHSRDRDKDKQFWQKALNALAERLMGDFLLDKGLTECPQLVLEGVLLRHANVLTCLTMMIANKAVQTLARLASQARSHGPS